MGGLLGAAPALQLRRKAERSLDPGASTLFRESERGVFSKRVVHIIISHGRFTTPDFWKHVLQRALKQQVTVKWSW